MITRKEMKSNEKKATTYPDPSEKNLFSFNIMLT